VRVGEKNPPFSGSRADKGKHDGCVGDHYEEDDGEKEGFLSLEDFGSRPTVSQQAA
jgi:hypothetical protein